MCSSTAYNSIAELLVNVDINVDAVKWDALLTYPEAWSNACQPMAFLWSRFISYYYLKDQLCWLKSLVRSASIKRLCSVFVERSFNDWIVHWWTLSLTSFRFRSVFVVFPLFFVSFRYYTVAVPFRSAYSMLELITRHRLSLIHNPPRTTSVG